MCLFKIAYETPRRLLDQTLILLYSFHTINIALVWGITHPQQMEAIFLGIHPFTQVYGTDTFRCCFTNSQ